MNSQLKTLESIMSFNEFVSDGIRYLRSLEDEDFKSEHKIERKVELPTGTLEQMKDIQVDLGKMIMSTPSANYDSSNSRPLTAIS